MHWHVKGLRHFFVCVEPIKNAIVPKKASEKRKEHTQMNETERIDHNAV